MTLDFLPACKSDAPALPAILVSKASAMVRLLLLALASAALLTACDSADTYVVRSKVNGQWQIDARARVEAGVATFECRHSASGACHFTVFAASKLDALKPVPDCSMLSTSMPSTSMPSNARCSATVLDRFTLGVQTHQVRRGLSGFKLCASDSPEPVQTDCTPLPRAAAAVGAAANAPA